MLYFSIKALYAYLKGFPIFSSLENHCYKNSICSSLICEEEPLLFTNEISFLCILYFSLWYFLLVISNYSQINHFGYYYHTILSNSLLWYEAYDLTESLIKDYWLFKRFCALIFFFTSIIFFCIISINSKYKELGSIRELRGGSSL